MENESVKEQADDAKNQQNDANQEELSSESESESSDDDLVLEGEVVRDPDVSSSSSDEDDDVEEDEPTSNKRKLAKGDKESNNKSSMSKKKRRKREDAVLEVEFAFCDMAEKFYYGLKNLLHNSSTIYQPHASILADCMIDNVSVGTVVSTVDDGDEGNVFGFASVLNATTYKESPAIQALRKACIDNCPDPKRKEELEVALSGTTARPVGFFLHGRMINMPMQVMLAMFQQLVKDIDWAVENAQGGEAERKSLDFGVFIRLAPCQKTNLAGGKLPGKSTGSEMYYRYFEDEFFAERAEFRYTMDAPKSYSKEDKQYIEVIVLTKAGHRAAMEDLARLIGS